MKFRVRNQQHVALMNRRPAANRRSVDAETFHKRRFGQLFNGIRDVMPQSQQIGKPQVENLRIVLPGKFEHGLRISHKKLLVGHSTAEAHGQPRLAPSASLTATIGRNAQTKESKPPTGRPQFDCFYGRYRLGLSNVFQLAPDPWPLTTALWTLTSSKPSSKWRATPRSRGRRRSVSAPSPPFRLRFEPW